MIMKFPLSDLNKINNLNPQKGNLILAEPFMEDDYFGRSVVFMCEHNKKGSYGFILNNKLEIFLDDIVPEIELKKINIYYGGPVNSTNLFYLHQLGDLIEDSTQISDNIWTSGDFNQIIEFINMGIIDITKIKFFLGYAGWTEGQLATEFKSNSWIALDLINEDIFMTDSDNLWKDILKKRGGKMKAIANFPLNPTDN